jgi:hypothetical protein
VQGVEEEADVTTRRHPGGLGRLRVRDGLLHLEVLDDAGHHLAVEVPLDPARRHAVHHLHALHDDATRCGAAPRTPADLLLDTVAVLDGQVQALVVAEGPPATFHLAVRGPFGVREVALDPVDAAGLIFSRRVRLDVRSAAIDWDAELRQLG